MKLIHSTSTHLPKSQLSNPKNAKEPSAFINRIWATVVGKRVGAEKRVARVKDIAQRMGVKSSSVTGALRSLAKRKLVNYAPYDVVTLTSKGEGFARDVVRRHEAIRTFFVNVLGVDEKEADEVACKMEHSISRPILERTIGFAEFVEICPRAGTKWLKEISRGCERGENVEECERCVASVLKEIRAEKRRGF